MDRASVPEEDSRGHSEPKVASNQVLTATAFPASTCQSESPKVPDGDRPNPTGERCSDKLDDKLSNKPYVELAQVVAVWPNLPEHIRAAIMALVRTA